MIDETLLHAALRKGREAAIESRGANGDGTGDSLRSGRASGDAWNGRIRKARWARQGGGKSGGVRTIYYYRVADSAIYLLLVYAKNEQEDLTPEQRKQAKKVVEVIEHGKRKS